ncbi:MAG: hypothetical protein K6L76_07990 [Agarilytica sp.]
MISVLTNKHFIVAMLVAPILAVLTWFAIGKISGPQPLIAKPGSSYPLIAKPNCRYESGQCTLINNDFRIDIHPYTSDQSKGTWLAIDSNFPIDGARFSLLDENGKTFMSADTSPIGNEGKQGILLPDSSNKISALRLALSSSEVFYYAETKTMFLLENE